jgi:hypothetical protein
MKPTSARWPAGFSEYPHEVQITTVDGRMTRKGMIRELLTMSGLEPDEYELRDDSKLRKKELAAIYLLVLGVANVE